MIVKARTSRIRVKDTLISGFPAFPLNFVGFHIFFRELPTLWFPGSNPRPQRHQVPGIHTTIPGGLSGASSKLGQLAILGIWTNEQAGIRRERGYGGDSLGAISHIKLSQGAANGGILPYPTVSFCIPASWFPLRMGLSLRKPMAFVPAQSWQVGKDPKACAKSQFRSIRRL